jgi:hypothetical protein
MGPLVAHLGILFDLTKFRMNQSLKKPLRERVEDSHIRFD